MQADLILKCPAYMHDNLISCFKVLTFARTLDISEVPLRPGLLPQQPLPDILALPSLHTLLTRDSTNCPSGKLDYDVNIKTTKTGTKGWWGRGGGEGVGGRGWF